LLQAFAMNSGDIVLPMQLLQALNHRQARNLRAQARPLDDATPHLMTSACGSCGTDDDPEDREHDDATMSQLNN